MAEAEAKRAAKPRREKAEGDPPDADEVDYEPEQYRDWSYLDGF